MKKLFMFAAAALMVGAVACDKNDDTKKPIGGGEEDPIEEQLDYTEPVTAWGDSPAEVIGSILDNGGEMTYFYRMDEEPISRGVGIVGTGDVEEYIYIFSGETAVWEGETATALTGDVALESIQFEFKASLFSAFKAFMDEKYVLVDSQDGNEYYADSETAPTTAIMLIKSANAIVYMDYSLAATRSQFTENFARTTAVGSLVR
jgi:hypothetical protein